MIWSIEHKLPTGFTSIHYKTDVLEDFSRVNMVWWEWCKRRALARTQALLFKKRGVTNEKITFFQVSQDFSCYTCLLCCLLVKLFFLVLPLLRQKVKTEKQFLHHPHHQCWCPPYNWTLLSFNHLSEPTFSLPGEYILDKKKKQVRYPHIHHESRIWNQCKSSLHCVVFFCILLGLFTALKLRRSYEFVWLAIAVRKRNDCPSAWMCKF